MSTSQYRARAREALRGQWGLAIVAFFIVTVISAISGALDAYSSFFDSPSAAFEIFADTYSLAYFILYGALSVGLAKLSLSIVRKDNPQLGTLFSQFKSNFLYCFLLNFLKGVFIFLWSMLLFIPGIVAIYRYRFAEYIMADDPSISPLDAITLSKNMTYGRKMDLFLLDLSFIGWFILSVATCGIGFLFLYPYMGITTAEFYEQAKAEYYDTGRRSDVNTKICPKCMNSTDMYAEFCPNCGYHFYNPENHNNSGNPGGSGFGGGFDNYSASGGQTTAGDGDRNAAGNQNSAGNHSSSGYQSATGATAAQSASGGQPTTGDDDRKATDNRTSGDGRTSTGDGGYTAAGSEIETSVGDQTESAGDRTTSTGNQTASDGGDRTTGNASENSSDSDSDNSGDRGGY